MQISNYFDDITKSMNEFLGTYSESISKMGDIYANMIHKFVIKSDEEGQFSSNSRITLLKELLYSLMFIEQKNNTNTNILEIQNDYIDKFVELLFKDPKNYLYGLEEYRTSFINFPELMEIISKLEKHVMELHRKLKKDSISIIEMSASFLDSPEYDENKIIENYKVKIVTLEGFKKLREVIDSTVKKIKKAEISTDKDLRIYISNKIKKLFDSISDKTIYSDNYKQLIEESFRPYITKMGPIYDSTKRIFMSMIQLFTDINGQLKKYTSDINKIYEKMDPVTILKKLRVSSKIEGNMLEYFIFPSIDADQNEIKIQDVNDEMEEDDEDIFGDEEDDIMPVEDIHDESMIIKIPFDKIPKNIDQLEKNKKLIKEYIEKKFSNIGNFIDFINTICETSISTKTIIQIIYNSIYISSFIYPQNSRIVEVKNILIKITEAIFKSITNIISIFIDPKEMVSNIDSISGGAIDLYGNVERGLSGDYTHDDFKYDLKMAYIKIPVIIKGFIYLLTGTDKEEDTAFSNTLKSEKIIKFNTIKNSKWNDLYNYISENMDNKIEGEKVINYINKASEFFTKTDNLSKDMISDLISTFTVSIRKSLDNTDNTTSTDVTAILNDITSGAKNNLSLTTRIIKITELYEKFIEYRNANKDDSELTKLKTKSYITKVLNTYNYDIDKSSNKIEKISILSKYLNDAHNSYFNGSEKIYSSYASTVYTLYVLLLEMIGKIKDSIDTEIIDVNYLLRLSYDFIGMENISFKFDEKNTIISINISSLYEKVISLYRSIQNIKNSFILFNPEADINEKKLEDEMKKYFTDIEESINNTLSSIRTDKIIRINKRLLDTDIKQLNDNYLLKYNGTNLLDRRLSFKPELNELEKKIMLDKYTKMAESDDIIYTTFGTSIYVPFVYTIDRNNPAVNSLFDSINRINETIFNTLNKLIIPSEFVDALKNGGFNYLTDPTEINPLVFNTPVSEYPLLNEENDNTRVITRNNNSVSVKNLGVSDVNQIVKYFKDPILNAFTKVNIYKDTISVDGTTTLPIFFKHVVNAISNSSKINLASIDNESFNKHVAGILVVIDTLSFIKDQINVLENSNMRDKYFIVFDQIKGVAMSLKNVLELYVKNIISDNDYLDKIFKYNNQKFKDSDRYNSDFKKEYQFMYYINKYIPEFNLDKVIEKMKISIVKSNDIQQDSFIASVRMMVNLYNLVSYGDDDLFKLNRNKEDDIKLLYSYNIGDFKPDGNAKFYLDFLKFFNINLYIPLSILEETGFSNIFVLGGYNKELNDINNIIEFYNTFISNLNSKYNGFIMNLIDKNKGIGFNTSKTLDSVYDIVYDRKYSGGNNFINEDEKNKYLCEFMSHVKKSLEKEKLTFGDLMGVEGKCETDNDEYILGNLEMCMEGAKQFLTKGTVLPVQKYAKEYIKNLMDIKMSKKLDDKMYYIIFAVYCNVYDKNKNADQEKIKKDAQEQVRDIIRNKIYSKNELLSTLPKNKDDIANIFNIKKKDIENKAPKYNPAFDQFKNIYIVDENVKPILQNNIIPKTSNDDEPVEWEILEQDNENKHENLIIVDDTVNTIPDGIPSDWIFSLDGRYIADHHCPIPYDGMFGICKEENKINCAEKLVSMALYGNKCLKPLISKILSNNEINIDIIEQKISNVLNNGKNKNYYNIDKLEKLDGYCQISITNDLIRDVIISMIDDNTEKDIINKSENAQLALFDINYKLIKSGFIVINNKKYTFNKESENNGELKDSLKYNEQKIDSNSYKMIIDPEIGTAFNIPNYIKYISLFNIMNRPETSTEIIEPLISGYLYNIRTDINIVTLQDYCNSMKKAKESNGVEGILDSYSFRDIQWDITNTIKYLYDNHITSYKCWKENELKALDIIKDGNIYCFNLLLFLISNCTIIQKIPLEKYIENNKSIAITMGGILPKNVPTKPIEEVLKHWTEKWNIYKALYANFALIRSHNGEHLYDYIYVFMNDKNILQPISYYDKFKTNKNKYLDIYLLLNSYLYEYNIKNPKNCKQYFVNNIAFDIPVYIYGLEDDSYLYFSLYNLICSSHLDATCKSSEEREYDKNLKAILDNLEKARNKFAEDKNLNSYILGIYRIMSEIKTM